MGILSWFGLGGDKPRSAEQIVPAVDLVRGTVCELGRDDTRASIAQRLGAPSAQDGRGLRYDAIGLHLAVAKAGAITGWSIFFTPPLRTQWMFGPERTRSAPTEADVVRWLGAPAKREVDEEEIMLTWERAGISLTVDFALDGTLNDILVDYA